MGKSLTRNREHAVDPQPRGVIVIDPATVHRCIGIAIGFLVFAAVWALVAVYPLDLAGSALGDVSVRLFDLDEEQGFPAAFSFLLLLATAYAVLLSTWANASEPSITRYAWRWRLLALALAFVAFDEAFAIHEWISGYLRATFGFSGFLHFAWVIPYGIGAMAVAAVMVKPLSALPRRIAAVLVAGGACYVLGAAVIEMVGGQLVSSNAPIYLYEIEILVEELLEWAGLWIFIAGLLQLLSGASLRMHVR